MATKNLANQRATSTNLSSCGCDAGGAGSGGRSPRRFDYPVDEAGRRLKVSALFGSNTFGLEKMRERLSRESFHKLQQVVTSGKKLDVETANAVAEAVKDWALEQGASHFCHWFQPQTGLTAERHDAFISLDSSGQAVEKFTGAQLIQSEPDASSFPSGGMRTTFEARGYTAWDPSSPIFLMESANGKTLCIPSVFVSYHGDALDEKTPLLRSMEYLNKNALALLHALGYKKAKRVLPTLGAEQEYFLVDRRFFEARPDLVMTGRTLVGQQPPRHQQMEDHYWGSVPTRVLAFMQEMEFELFRLGIPAKTRHNEVAPSQFEIAPIFEEANIASDHNQLMMEVMRKVAERHGYAVLLHEKPFAGVNGSGKHNNWSMMVTGEDIEDPNLLEPGKTPHQNIRFLAVLACVLRGLQRHAGLMRAAIASPGNDHRLGANEAPPAIISAFLGNLLSDIVSKIESGTNLDQSPEQVVLGLGVAKIPSVMRDNTDRNRTSPFAFTGNKFEFRAVGSSMSCAFPMTALNTAVAEAMGEVAEEIKKRAKNSQNLDGVVLEVVRDVFKETRAIRFEGNGYSQDWVLEAERRGLPQLKRAPEAIEQLVTPSSKRLFTESGVLSDAELHSRYHVMVERYVKLVSIEAETLVSMMDAFIVPSGLKEQTLVAQSMAAVTVVNRSAPMTEQGERLQGVTDGINQLLRLKKTLSESLKRLEQLSTEKEKAHFLSRDVLALMTEVRSVSDRLESVVSDEFWTLPKYQQMLFLNS